MCLLKLSNMDFQLRQTQIREKVQGPGMAHGGTLHVRRDFTEAHHIYNRIVYNNSRNLENSLCYQKREQGLLKSSHPPASSRPETPRNATKDNFSHAHHHYKRGKTQTPFAKPYCIPTCQILIPRFKVTRCIANGPSNYLPRLHKRISGYKLIKLSRPILTFRKELVAICILQGILRGQVRVIGAAVPPELVETCFHNMG